jgi:hypothetical protein
MGTYKQSALIGNGIKVTEQVRENLDVLYLAIRDRYEKAGINCESFEEVSNMFVRNLVIEEIVNCLGDLKS